MAVSHETSPRRQGLLWAAQLAGVDVVVPGQPVWMEGDVRAFKSKEGSVISRGSALAWMGHLNALRWYVDLWFGCRESLSKTPLSIDSRVLEGFHLVFRILLVK